MATVEQTVTEYIWTTWVETSNSASVTASTYDDYDSTSTAVQDSAWTNWCSNGTQTTTYTDNQATVWRIWSGTYKYQIKTDGSIVILNEEDEEKSKEQERAEEAQRQLDRIWRDLKIKEHEEEKEQAEDTALILLGELVSPVELEHYKRFGEILVKGKKCDYIVRKGKGVIKVEKNKVTSLCIHLKELSKYPPTDNTIAVKLLIEGEEKEFNKIANHSNMCGGDVSYWRKKVEDILEKYTESRRVA